jgi:hypothetical protein
VLSPNADRRIPILHPEVGDSIKGERAGVRYPSGDGVDPVLRTTWGVLGDAVGDTIGHPKVSVGRGSMTKSTLQYPPSCNNPISALLDHTANLNFSNNYRRDCVLICVEIDYGTWVPVG